MSEDVTCGGTTTGLKSASANPLAQLNKTIPSLSLMLVLSLSHPYPWSSCRVAFEQDIIGGRTSQLGDCEGVYFSIIAGFRRSKMADVHQEVCG